MSKQFTLLMALAILILLSFTRTEMLPNVTVVGRANAQNAQVKSEYSSANWNDLKKYIGKYVKDTDFFENLLIKTELKRILGDDYARYQEHVALSGSGEIDYKYGLIYGDVSQEHVGSYNSLIFINTRDKKMYLFWLIGAVGEKKYKIYGDKPIPANVLNIIVEEMNIGWGHVAEFKIDGDSIDIKLK